MADCLIYQVAEEKTGVKMEYEPLSTASSNEQFNVIMASGSYPDLIGWGLNYATGDDAAVDEEIYLDIAEYVAEYAPNYYNILSTDDELLKSALTDSGYLVGFHALRTEQTLGKAGLVIRTDLLNKLGLDKPYTIDEFENVLAAFKDEGVAQPLVMLAPGAIQDNWLAGAFDVAAFCNNFPMSVAPTYVQDGEIKFGPLEDGFKEYITLIHDWYEKGYIDSDFISKNTNWNGPDYSNIITNGDAGIFYTDQGNIGGYIEASEVEGFDLEATYDMHATEDSVNHFAQYKKKSASNGFHITTNCSNIELACQWGDWWYTDEASFLANYGVEGISFEYVDGVPQFTETVTKAPEGQRDALLIYASNDSICCVIDGNAESSSYAEVDKAAPEIWNTGMDDSYVIPSTVSLSADENTEASNIYSDIETTCMEYIAKFINGDKSLDEYDDFVATIEAMNIQGYLDIQQEAYDRAMSK
jgi:putative aldouronate transport system substrate-binding protein